MEKKLLLIDGNSVAYRAFFALYNSLERFKNRNGLHTNALYAFKNMLDSMLKREKPSNVLVAFDAGKKTFRTEKFSEYKANRSKTPSEFSEQMPYFKELLTGYGIESYQLENYEADDIIATMAKKGENLGYKVTIVTGDRDLIQLVNENTVVEVTIKGVSKLEKYTVEHIAEKYNGLKPNQIIDMKALMGDSSDNYQGVSKVGEKTALKLLNQYNSLDHLYKSISEMKQSKLKENLINDKEKAFLAQELATIKTDAPVEIEIEDTKFKEKNLEKLRNFYQSMDFNHFLSQIEDTSSVEIEDVDCIKLDEKIIKNIDKNSEELTIQIELSDENYHQAEFLGFSLKIGEKYFVSSDVQLLKEENLRYLLESSTVKVNLFDIKKTYVSLNRLGIKLKNVDFDLLLVSYLLDTNDNSNDLGKLVRLYDYQDVNTDKEIYGTGASKKTLTENQLFSHLANKVKAISALKVNLLNKLSENKQDELYYNIELLLAIVLAKMEIEGITVDVAQLKKMGVEFKKRLEDFQSKIYLEAGEKFNINSPKQLGIILFEKLKLPVIKKTKTGYSTAVDVLEQLKGMTPIIENLLKYRQLSKLQSTYIEGLLKVVSSDSKVHTRYIQTLTATGRLSSIDPNLQNIPIRFEEGRKIRTAFVANKKNWKIFSSDYSQIELRVLAHISNDKNMQEAFLNGYDIHSSTAMKIFDLNDKNQVTSEMRRRAKAVNFGIVYGISDYGLAQSINSSRKEAKEFIQNYFEAFPKVHKYMDEIVQFAKRNGYVETLFHRRRYLPDINSKNFNLRSFAQRTAMNTPIQGSAADIIKVAMINMDKKLKELGLKTKMLLQVHDELIFEAPEDEIEILKKVVPSVMDSAVKLSVPLKVETKYGATWFDAK